MKSFSLRRRVMSALVLVFLFGVAATSLFYRLELRHEIRAVHLELEPQPKSANEVERLLSRMRNEDLEFLGWVLVPVSLFGTIIIWMVLRWSLRGLSVASEEAAGLKPQQLDRRLTYEGLPTELHGLVRAVNLGLERLEVAHAAERRITADCAHELRTPLAVLRLRLESGRQRFLDWPLVQRDLEHLERLVNQLLDLARKESAGSQTRARTPVNLTRVMREVAAMLQPLAQRQGRQIEVEAAEAVQVLGHSADLADMVRNLLDNSLVHGHGRILAQLSIAGRMVQLSVSDEGRGIPSEQTERVFERFVKLNQSSSGAGLGLCIVRRVAEDHEGACGVTPRTGAVFVSMPILMT